MPLGQLLKITFFRLLLVNKVPLSIQGMRIVRGSGFLQGGAGWGKKVFSQGGAGQEKTCAGRGAHPKSKLYDTLVQTR